jgi:hypothetical protein
MSEPYITSKDTCRNSRMAGRGFIMSHMTITTTSPNGESKTIIIPHLNQEEVDLLYEIVGNDEMIEAANKSNDLKMGDLLAPWLNSLSEREFKQVSSICLGRAHYKENGLGVSFELKIDEVKILSAVIYRNLVPICVYLNSQRGPDA